MRSEVFSRWVLAAGGLGVLLGALLHVGVLIGGPEWIAFVGAPPSIVQSAREGTWLAPVTTLGIAAVLTFWALYAFSGIGWIRPLPLLKPVLGFVAFIFIVRGVMVLPFLKQANMSSGFDLFAAAASFFILVVGCAYALGLYRLLRTS